MIDLKLLFVMIDLKLLFVLFVQDHFGNKLKGFHSLPFVDYYQH